MSSTLNQVSASDLQADKPATETSIDQQTSPDANQADNLNNDTNSTSQHEVSPLKRNVSEISGNADDHTPARSTKKSRIDRFKEESEALLKSFGLKEGTDSEKRLTRSRTRGTPATTPVSKPEPRKATTGAKRGRKPTNEKKEEDETPVVVKTTIQKKNGRASGRNARKEEEPVETVENSESMEVVEDSEPVKGVAGDENQVEQAEEQVKKNDLKTETKETDQSVPNVTDETKTTNESTNEVTPESAVQKEAASTTDVKIEEESKSTVAETTVANSTSESASEDITNSVTNDSNGTNVENNVSDTTSTTNNQTNEQVNKNVTEPIETSDKAVEEKVISSNDAKSSESSVVEKQEVQTA